MENESEGYGGVVMGGEDCSETGSVTKKEKTDD